MNEYIEILKQIYHKELLPHWIEALATVFAAIFAFVGLPVAWISIRKDIKGQQSHIKN